MEKEERLLEELEKLLSDLANAESVVENIRKTSLGDFNIHISNKGKEAIREIEGKADAVLFGLSDLVYLLYSKCGMDKEIIKQCVQIGFDYKDKHIMED